MVIPGRVRNGVVVLEGGPALPEGIAVTVSCDLAPEVETAQRKRRVDVPLVPSRNPGTLHLTAKRVAEFLEEDDLSSTQRASPFLPRSGVTRSWRPSLGRLVTSWSPLTKSLPATQV